MKCMGLRVISIEYTATEVLRITNRRVLIYPKKLICRKYHTHKRSAIDTDKVFTHSCKITRTYQFYLWRSTTTMQITCERSKHK